MMKIEEIQPHWSVIRPYLSIRNEEDYDRVIEQLNHLIDEVGMDEQNPMYEFLDTLGTIIHAYEERHYPVPQASGAEVLEYPADFAIRNLVVDKIISFCYISIVYKIVFTRQVAKTLRKMPRNWSSLIREKLDQLTEDPYRPQNNVTKLQNRAGYRLRAGNWRILYDIQDEQLVILVLKLGPRGEVYR